MYKLALTLALTLSLAWAAGAYTITGATDPKLGYTNLFPNGDMENGVAGPDGGWTPHAMPPGFVTKWSTFAYTGKRSLYLKTTVNSFVGYWKTGTAQRVPAGQELMFSYWINMPWGIAAPYVYGYYDVDGKGKNDPYQAFTSGTSYTTQVNPLYPVFVKDAKFLSHKILGKGWNRVCIMIGKRPMDFVNDTGTLLMLKYLPSGEGKPCEMWIDKVYFGISRVNLTVKIRGDLSKIKELRVYNDANDLAWSTTEVPKSGEFTIPVLADSCWYKVVVRDTDGNEHSQIIR